MDKERARTLRAEMRDAEKRLWGRLRKRQVGAYRFRRQHPLGRYIVDFVCLEARLVVEVTAGSMGNGWTTTRSAAHGSDNTDPAYCGFGTMKS